ncbi:MAG TPA: PEP-CTERM sorting domain-containing protein [Pyrinomonadaceae bacterium]|jgi:hypothetical protein
MRQLVRIALALIGLMASVDRASAQVMSLDTIYATNNGGASLWTMYFDANVTNAPGINIVGFDTNTTSAVGTNFTLDFYTTAPGGTYVGNTSNPGAWTFQGTTLTGTAAGTDLHSHVDLATPVLVPFGTQGFALRYNGITPSYTNGTGSNQNFSDPNLALTLGASQATTTAPFTGGSPFSPRVWNGTIYYTTSPAPEPTTLLTVGLAGGIGFVVRRARRGKATD